MTRQTTEPSSERASFEAEYRLMFPASSADPDKFEQNGTGGYEDFQVNNAWRFWRARALLSTEAKPVVDGDLPPLPEWPEGFPDEWLITVSSMMRDYARTALPAAKPAREWLGLTDEERRVVINDWRWKEGKVHDLCIAIESKLREKNATTPAAGGSRTWCKYVAGMICTYLNEPPDSKLVDAIAGIIERRLWALKSTPAAGGNLTEELQQQCSDWGTYWRAPDAHGVVLNLEQATELLRRALGVEVEIKPEAGGAGAVGQVNYVNPAAQIATMYLNRPDAVNAGDLLYTHPQLARTAEPLTDDKIDDLSREMVKGGKSVNWLARAIEAAHGIKSNV